MPVKGLDMARAQFLYRNIEIVKIRISTAMDISPVGTVCAAVKRWGQAFQPQDEIVAKRHFSDRGGLLLIADGIRLCHSKDMRQRGGAIRSPVAQQLT